MNDFLIIEGLTVLPPAHQSRDVSSGNYSSVLPHLVQFRGYSPVILLFQTSFTRPTMRHLHSRDVRFSLTCEDGLTVANSKSRAEADRQKVLDVLQYAGGFSLCKWLQFAARSVQVGPSSGPRPPQCRASSCTTKGLLFQHPP